MCFVWISEQTAIISLYNINWLVFITETQCVYCAVRTGYLYIIQGNLAFQSADTRQRTLPTAAAAAGRGQPYGMAVQQWNGAFRSLATGSAVCDVTVLVFVNKEIRKLDGTLRPLGWGTGGSDYRDIIRVMGRPSSMEIFIHSLLFSLRGRTGRNQSPDHYGSGTLHPGQVLGGSLPLLSPDIHIYIYI